MAKGKSALTETEQEADRNAAIERPALLELTAEPLDPELFALQIIISALQELDETTRTRVLGYVNERFGGAA